MFDGVLGERANQLDRLREDVHITAEQLLDIPSAGGSITRAGLRGNIAVGLRYLGAWLAGTGAVGIFNLMEDAATAEISRTQIWQWIRNNAVLDDGTQVTAELVRKIADEELTVIADELGHDAYAKSRYPQARQLFEQVTLADDFVDFLTLPAYELID